MGKTIISLLWMLSSCGFAPASNNSTTNDASDSALVINNEVKKDRIFVQFLGYKDETGSFSIFDGTDEQKKILSRKEDVLSFQWDTTHVFSLLTLPFMSYYPIDKGDSIRIKFAGQLQHPIISIRNSKFNEFEINFPGFLSKANYSIIEYSARKMLGSPKVPANGSIEENYLRSGAMLDSLVKIGKISTEYEQWIKPILSYSYYTALLDAHEKLPDNFKVYDESQLNSHHYRRFLTRYYIQQELKTTYAKVDFSAAYDYAQKLSLQKAVKDYLLFFSLKNILEQSPDKKRKYISSFLAESSNNTYNTFVKDNYYSNQENYKEDVVINADLNALKLDSFLTTLKNKVVYVDFWASWCVPCRAEMPNAAKLRDEFSGKDVAFVYISIDEKLNDWKQAAEEEKLTNLNNNFLLLNPKSSKIAKFLKLSTIPRYLLIDKNGKIINGSAPSPTSPLIKNLVNDLLKK